MKRFSFHASQKIKASSRRQQTRVIQVAAVGKHLKDLSVCHGLILPSASLYWETPDPRSIRDKTVMFDLHLTSMESIDVEKCTSDCADCPNTENQKLRI